MMQVLVSDIPAEGLELAFTVEAADLELTLEGARFVHPISAELLLLCAGSAVRVTGRLALAVMFGCVRCLREFLATYEVPVNAQYLPGPPSAAAGEHVMPVNEAENYYYRDKELVLDDLVRQEVLLAMPYSPQCGPNCQGLCVQCGQDLNTGKCDCAPPPDPRLAALREYLKKK
jgi:uncharacterized protein